MNKSAARIVLYPFEQQITSRHASAEGGASAGKHDRAEGFVCAKGVKERSRLLS